MRRREVITALTCMLQAIWAWAGNEPGQTGQFNAAFTNRSPHSALQNIIKRMDLKLDKTQIEEPYKIGEESYSVYVPTDYKPDTAYGLMVWISAGDSGGIPGKWKPVMDKNKLIWIGPNKAGNNHSVFNRRIPLALDAVYNMTNRYTISANRVYVAGLSGGGRTASVAAMHYPDVFAGGIFVVGVDYWESMPIPKSKQFYQPGMTKPKAEYLSIAKQKGRYVLLTGDKDSNRNETELAYNVGYKKNLSHVSYIQVPDMGHDTPPADWWEKAIIYLDTAPNPPKPGLVPGKQK